MNAPLDHRPRILVVDDEAPMLELLRLGLPGFDVTTAPGVHEALLAVETFDVDLVVTDLVLGAQSGVDLCKSIVANRPDVPVVVLTGFGSFEAAVLALRAGASDFVTKPVDMDVLAITLERALTVRALRAEVKRLRTEVERGQGLPGLVGSSAAIRRVADVVARVADSDATVLVTGESGTGKEVVARALHAQGNRSGKPFVAINCAAMPETLLESELFGHVRGAFTDAKTARKGLFVQAEGGTVFLDEIAEMPIALQAKLLRALQERTVRQVGGAAEIPFDVRVVAATNKDLEAEIERGGFREDLFYRLAVITLELPPLRARGDDVLLLAQHFLRTFAGRAHKTIVGLSIDAAERLRSYAWPGNVRELANCMERAVAFARYDEIVSDDLPEKLRASTSSRPMAAGEGWEEVLPLEEIERRYALWAFEKLGRNKSLAAQTLRIDRKTLARKLGDRG